MKYTLILITLIAASCKKKTVESAPPPTILAPPIAAEAEFYFRPTMDGVAYDISYANENSVGSFGTTNTLSLGDSLITGYHACFMSNDVPPYFSIGINGNSYGSMSLATFDAYYGNLPLTYFSDIDSTHGIEVRIDDQVNLSQWSTRFGSQAGSTFTISSNTASAGFLFGSHMRRIKGTLKCKVYDPTGATFKNITSATYSIYIDKYF